MNEYKKPYIRATRVGKTHRWKATCSGEGISRTGKNYKRWKDAIRSAYHEWAYGHGVDFWHKHWLEPIRMKGYFGR